jgi:RNA polymerase sigma-70 factor (ECF subfamily)
VICPARPQKAASHATGSLLIIGDIFAPPDVITIECPAFLIRFRSKRHKRCAGSGREMQAGDESFLGAHPYYAQAFMMSYPVETMLETFVDFQSEAARLHSGDVNAVAGLMERYQHRLYRYLLRMVSQPSTAEDLFQQTWLRIIERIKRYDPKRNFEGWLFAVAHNLAIDHLRRRRYESLDAPGFTGETHAKRIRSSDPGSLEQLLSKDRFARILEAISDLPAPFREVITLRFEEEMKIEEIAGVLLMPIGTVKTRLHRALKALRESLEKRFVIGVEL